MTVLGVYSRKNLGCQMICHRIMIPQLVYNQFKIFQPDLRLYSCKNESSPLFTLGMPGLADRVPLCLTQSWKWHPVSTAIRTAAW